MLTNAGFCPPPGLRNCHVQTLLPKWLHRRPLVDWQSEELTLADGDFVELAWVNRPTASSRQPLLLVLHGLEGNIHSHYVQIALAAARARGWHGLLMHFRNCGRRVNRLPRLYHSGDTTDVRFLINWLQCQFPHLPLRAMGFSLGGNVLTRYLAEEGRYCPLEKAVVVSAPLDLAACCRRIMQGSSRIYQRYLLGRLRRSLARKWRQTDLSAYVKASKAQIMSVTNLWQFDDWVTAPLHGFRDAADYYCRASGKPLLGDIRVDSLFLHAADDPFLAPEVVPDAAQLPPGVRFEISRYGGHVGFMQRPGGPFWYAQRGMAFLT